MVLKRRKGTRSRITERKVWWGKPKRRGKYYNNYEYYLARLKYLKSQGFKEVDHRIIDVGRPKKHYVKLVILQKGTKRVSVGYLMKKR